MQDNYQKAETIANLIESELKSLQAWSSIPLAPDKYSDMGAFGCKTMSYVQWLQFVLLPRVREVVELRGEFPGGSMLSTYAIREFGINPDYTVLRQHLNELDDLVNGNEQRDAIDPEEEIQQRSNHQDTITIGDTTIPEVVLLLADALPQFSGEDLESQLQSFDSFLTILSPIVRPAFSDFFIKASQKASDSASRQRLEKAAKSVLQGGRAAEPYNHIASMRKYQNTFSQ